MACTPVQVGADGRLVYLVAGDYVTIPDRVPAWSSGIVETIDQLSGKVRIGYGTRELPSYLRLHDKFYPSELLGRVDSVWRKDHMGQWRELT